MALSETDATAMGLADGDLAVVTGDRGALTANVVVADVVTGVVRANWLARVAIS